MPFQRLGDSVVLTLPAAPDEALEAAEPGRRERDERGERRETGSHPTQIDPADPDGDLMRRLLGGLTSQLEAIASLRNRVGTGHGRAGDVSLDTPLARLVISQALSAVTYLLQASDLHAQNTATPGRTGRRAPGSA